MYVSSLSALLRPEWKDLLTCRELVDFLDKQSVPINCISDQPMRSNIDEYQETYHAHGLDPKILFAAKCNKSNLFIKCAESKGIGVEVSSVGELEDALNCGITPDSITASGPLKDEAYLISAARYGVIIALDDEQELEILDAHRAVFARKPNVLIRINLAPTSRFGITLERTNKLLRTKSFTNMCVLRGFSFHINNYSINDRVAAIQQLSELIMQARGQGYSDCDSIDIGGGFTINYVDSSDWSRWTALSDTKAYFRNEYQPSSTYPYSSECTRSSFLASILSYATSGAMTVGRLLAENGIKLYIEPGRSLLDQCGMTIFRIQGIKDFGDYKMIIVNGNINSLSEQWFDSEFLVDPVLVPRNRSSRSKRTVTKYCVGGNLCLESDMLTRRFINFSANPQRGDYLAYINTAGYQMDSNESDFARFNLPKKVIVTQSHNKWEFIDDN